MEIKTGQLLIYDPRSASRLTEILFQSPDSEEQAASLFVVIDMASSDSPDKEAEQAVLETVYSVYNNSILKQANKTLEDILAALNEQLPLAVKNYDWFRKLNMAVGLIEGNHVYFGLAGKIKIFLIKQAVIKDLAGRFAWPENNVLFDSTFSGELKNGDKMLITSPSLTDYLSLEKIKKIVAALPPLSAVAHIQNILEGVPSRVSFASLIIQPLFYENLPADPQNSVKLIGRLKEPTGSKNSLDLLLKTHAETDKILTAPSIWEIMWEYAKNGLNFIKKLKGKNTPKAAAITIHKTARASLHASSHASLVSRKIAKHAVKIILNALKTVLTFIFDNNYRKDILHKIEFGLKTVLKSFHGLPKIQKIAIISIAALALIFSQSLILQQKLMEKKKAENLFSSLSEQISQKYNAMDASLIYNKDNKRASLLLNEINNLTEQLPEISKKHREKKALLYQQYKQTYARVWKMVEIPQPLELIDFSQNKEDIVEINKLGIADGRLFGFSINKQSFSFPLNSHADAEELEISESPIILAAYFPAINALIAVSENNEFFKVEQNKFSHMAANLPAELKNIDGIAFFQNYMYLLDKQANQIFRLTLYGNSFSSPKFWLASPEPLEQATSFTVDGEIDILQIDGSVLTFAGGKQQKQLSLTISPPFNSPTVLRSPENSINYYILDPQNKRFVIFDKKGELKNQFSSPCFNDLKDMIADEANGLVYLLNGVKVFVVSVK